MNVTTHWAVRAALRSVLGIAFRLTKLPADPRKAVAKINELWTLPDPLHRRLEETEADEPTPALEEGEKRTNLEGRELVGWKAMTPVREMNPKQTAMCVRFQGSHHSLRIRTDPDDEKVSPTCTTNMDLQQGHPDRMILTPDSCFFDVVAL